MKGIIFKFKRRSVRSIMRKCHDVLLRGAAILCIAWWPIALFMIALGVWSMRLTVITFSSVLYMALFLMINEPPVGGGILYRMGIMDKYGNIVPSDRRRETARKGKEQIIKAKNKFNSEKERIRKSMRVDSVI